MSLKEFPVAIVCLGVLEINIFEFTLSRVTWVSFVFCVTPGDPSVTSVIYAQK